MPCLAESRGDLSAERKHLVGNDVGKITGVGMSLYLFRRVEFRGVRQQQLDL
jgi:hypothetical protein